MPKRKRRGQRTEVRARARLPDWGTWLLGLLQGLPLRVRREALDHLETIRRTLVTEVRLAEAAERAERESQRDARTQYQ